MTKFKSLFLLALSISVLIACSSEPDEVKPVEKNETPSKMVDEHSEEYEKYITSIDENDSLAEGNTLYYSKDNGQSYEVKFDINDSSEILRMTEYYTKSATGSILSNIFYYKEGVLYASKEYFEKGSIEDGYFVERVSYYDDKGESLVTKVRTAPFEDVLDQETFKITENHICSDERARTALRQEGEFATYYKGIVTDGQLRYILVGEQKSGGFESALLIQYNTPFAISLIQNEKQMLGTHLVVNFESINDATGYTYQGLIHAREADEEEKSL